MILDSTILIYSANPAYDYLLRYLEDNADSLSISLISKLEVLGYHRIRPDHKIALEQLIEKIGKFPVSSEIIETAIRLRQQRKRSMGDSIIAATALIHKLPVLTNNTADFLDIPGVEVIALDSIPRT